MNRSHLLKLLVCLLATGYGPSYAETNTYVSDLARLEKVEKESIQADLRTEDAARTIAAAYQELFGNVDALSVKDRPDILKTMFAAASTTALHTNSSSHANTMRTYYDLLKSAGDGTVKSLTFGRYPEVSLEHDESPCENGRSYLTMDSLLLLAYGTLNEYRSCVATSP